MQQPVVIIGIGELGGVFAGAFLKNGHPVYPITLSWLFEGVPSPAS